MPESISYRLSGKLGSTQSLIPFDSRGDIELPALSGAPPQERLQ
jgi:hypothetical protein